MDEERRQPPLPPPLENSPLAVRNLKLIVILGLPLLILFLIYLVFPGSARLNGWLGITLALCFLAAVLAVGLFLAKDSKMPGSEESGFSWWAELLWWLLV
jgi:hypothetical protein